MTDQTIIEQELDSGLRCNLDGAIGGTYRLPDGREFWMDATAVREVLARIEPVIISWLEAHGQSSAVLPTQDTGVPCGSGSRPSDRAASAGVSPVPASIPNAEWLSHPGGGCPLHGNTLVMVQFRDGLVSEIAEASLWFFSKDQGRSLWIHRGRANDIVAYWIADPERRASAIEARSVETGNTDSARQGESAAPKEGAQ